MYGTRKKSKGKSSCAEDTRELLKLALEEKPNAFREVFDEIMLAKIVDISDEMKNDIAQSMFGESSHEYGEDKGGRRRGKKETKHERDNHVGESFEPEDEEEYEDEDEDFDISDEDLEDLDLDDEDFEDEEQIEEAMDKIVGDTPFGELTKGTTTKERQQMVAAAAERRKIVDKFLNRAPNVNHQIGVMKTRLGILGKDTK